VGIRLITRRGNDWTTRYPLVVEAVNHLKVRFCLIHGEVVCCGTRTKTPPPEKGAGLSLRPHLARVAQSDQPWSANPTSQ
jgi:ATP-dependent DNA ligase